MELPTQSIFPEQVKTPAGYFKMGYGGLELGYIILSAKKVNIGISLLIAAGAAFWQNNPKSNSEKLFDDDFNIFPVLEPSLYGEVALNRFMWLHAGISYQVCSSCSFGLYDGSKHEGFFLLHRSAFR